MRWATVSKIYEKRGAGIRASKERRAGSQVLRGEFSQ